MYKKTFKLQEKYRAQELLFIPWDFDILNMLQPNTKPPVRPHWMLLPSTHIRITELPAWNTTMKQMPGLTACFLRVFSWSSWHSPLLFLLNFWLVNHPSLWKLYPTPGPPVGFDTLKDLFDLLGVGSESWQGSCVVVALLSPQTPYQNELGEIDGQVKKKPGWLPDPQSLQSAEGSRGENSMGVHFSRSPLCFPGAGCWGCWGLCTNTVAPW